MKHKLLVIFAMVAFGATGAEEFRRIGDKVYHITASEWTTFTDGVRVTRLLNNKTLGCTRFTAQTVQGQVNVAAGGRKSTIEPTFRSVEHVQGGFYVVNHPMFATANIGTILQTPMKVMKIGVIEGLPLYDYGIPWAPPVKAATPAEIAAAKTGVDTKKAEADAALLKWHRQLAEKGDARGLYLMGCRYLKGDGVDADPAKAEDCFKRSASLGNEDAKEALAKLHQTTSKSVDKAGN